MKLGRNITAATGCCSYTTFSISHLEWRLHELLKWEHDHHHVMQDVVVELRKMYGVFKGIDTWTTCSRDMAAARILYFVCGFKTITNEPLELVM